tara:strand:+ start:395 stop:691 length:297 start_codon:yes stop_codon:yes gene_type:complete
MLFLLLLCCGKHNKEFEELIQVPQEAYEWECVDKEEYTEIDIIAGVCNDFDELHVSVELINNRYNEKQMIHEGGCWWTTFIIQEENCIEIQEIIITAQ